MARVRDTSDEAAAVQLATLRARSPEQRFLEAVALSEMMHAVVMARLRARYPEKSVVELAFDEEVGSCTSNGGLSTPEDHPFCLTVNGALVTPQHSYPYAGDRIRK
mgnify:CR=1 FL=1